MFNVYKESESFDLDMKMFFHNLNSENRLLLATPGIKCSCFSDVISYSIYNC